MAEPSAGGIGTASGIGTAVPAFSERLRSQAATLVSLVSRQFPVAERLTLGWLTLDEHVQAVELLWWTARQLAERQQGSVVLVDGDERRKTLTRCCGLRTARGLAELVRAGGETQPLLVDTPIEGLRVLPAGQGRQVRFQSKHLETVLNRTASASRFCLILLGDCESDLSMGLARSCDAVFPLLHAGRTRRRTAIERVRQWSGAGVPLSGCVLLTGTDSGTDHGRGIS